MAGSNWHTITESRFPWERDALEFVRSRLPDREPYRAWANFEFIADDGSINEVDLLVLTPMGFFLVEVKSRPGIMAAIERRDCPGLEKSVKHHVDRPTAKAVSQAMDQAGIRPSRHPPHARVPIAA